MPKEAGEVADRLSLAPRARSVFWLAFFGLWIVLIGLVALEQPRTAGLLALALSPLVGLLLWLRRRLRADAVRIAVCEHGLFVEQAGRRDLVPWTSVRAIRWTRTPSPRPVRAFEIDFGERIYVAPGFVGSAPAKRIVAAIHQRAGLRWVGDVAQRAP